MHNVKAVELIAVVAVAVLLSPLGATTASEFDQWLLNFTSIEHTLVNNEDYLIKLSDAFRPTNGHSNSIVKVEYVLEPLEINSDLGPKSCNYFCVAAIWEIKK